MSLSSKQIEKQIENYPVWYLHYSFQPVEYGKGVYKGIAGYNQLRQEQPHMIPTEKEFVSRFISITLPLFSLDKVGLDYEKYKLGLTARAKRAYRSLVREEHCTARMKELYEPHNFQVLYDNDTDWQKGIDVTIRDLEECLEYYVHLFVDSPKAREHRKHKAKRGYGRDFTNHIDLPFKKSEGKKVGFFDLYSDDTLMDFMYKLRASYKHMGTEIKTA